MDGDLKITYYAGEPLGIPDVAHIDQSKGIAISRQLTADETNLAGTL